MGLRAVAGRGPRAAGPSGRRAAGPWRAVGRGPLGRGPAFSKTRDISPYFLRELIAITCVEHKCKIFLSLSRHIEKQLGKRSEKNFLFARILKPNKPAKDWLFLSKKSTDDCYLIPVNNKNSSFIPEQREKRLNNFLEIRIHLK